MDMSKQKEAAIARKAKREADEEKFPAAAYNLTGELQVFIDSGDPLFIRIRTNKLASFRPSRVGGDDGWVECAIPILGIVEFSGLIACMTARLNAMIEEANASTAKINITQMERIG